MKNVIKHIIESIDSITKIIGELASLLLIPMVILLVFEVVMRYIFNDPTKFSHELSTFFFGGIGMIVGAYTYLYNGHVTLDIIYGKLSPKKRAWMDLITFPFFFFFCVALIFEGWKMAYTSFLLNEHTSTPWGPPLYPFKFIIPISAILLLIQGLKKLFKDTYFLFYGKELS